MYKIEFHISRIDPFGVCLIGTMKLVSKVPIRTSANIKYTYSIYYIYIQE